MGFYYGDTELPEFSVSSVPPWFKTKPLSHQHAGEPLEIMR